MKSLKKLILKSFVASFVFSVTFVGILYIVSARSWLQVSPWDKLQASKRNELVSKLFWNSSGSSIYYNAWNVWIGINNPTQTLEVNGNIKSNNTWPSSFSLIYANIWCLWRTINAWYNTAVVACPSGSSIIFVSPVNINMADTIAYRCQVSWNWIVASTWCSTNIDWNSTVFCQWLCVKN